MTDDNIETVDLKPTMVELDEVLQLVRSAMKENPDDPEEYWWNAALEHIEEGLKRDRDH